MLLRRVLSSVVVIVWLGTLAFSAGPARWEFAHTYQHWIEGVEEYLPELTSTVGLPILGLGSRSFVSSILGGVFWAFAWLSPVALLIGVWRMRSQQALSDWLLYGSALYLSIMLLAFAVIVVSLWLPFGLLG